MLVVVAVRLKLGIQLLWILRQFSLVLLILTFISFVADVVKSFDTVDRGILDRVLSSLGLPAWFRNTYFEYHAHVRLRFLLASGLGEPWNRYGGIPQGCPLSMMFIVALYLPWCRFLAAHEGVQPQLCADNLKCVFRDPHLLLIAARLPLAMFDWLARSLLLVSALEHFQGGSEGYEGLGAVSGGR